MHISLASNSSAATCCHRDDVIINSVVITSEIPKPGMLGQDAERPKQTAAESARLGGCQVTASFWPMSSREPRVGVWRIGLRPNAVLLKICRETSPVIRYMPRHKHVHKLPSQIACSRTRETCPGTKVDRIINLSIHKISIQLL